MGLSIGIVGLPNVGKSTLFNALLGAAQAAAANYPFCTIEPNVGVVPVPDARLDALSALFKPKKTTPTTLEFVDIAGLVAGASKGEGLGNQFLANIREVDAIAHVLRCFEDPDVVHVAGKVDPRGDRDVVETELMLKDLDSVEKKRERALKNTKAAGKAGELAKLEVAALDRVKAGLEAGTPVRAQPLSDDDRAAVKDLFLLTSKPVLYIANVDESQLGKEATDPSILAVKALADAEGAPMVEISGKVESELVELAPPERAEYLASLGLEEPGLHRLVHAGYRLLGLMTYFTSGEDECRAWTVRQGSRAPQAAGVIHTDFEKGFIKAEVIRIEDLLELKTEAACREKGKLRIEGKDYVVQDGDVMHFRFNV
ncbi:GTP-binding protein YchF [Anaeromyxobacter dehalogenans 2CP-1]|uniref:Ribosome-binding ATPase YchF n=1 Tax=Anaeromyxobacter dehalogenans (strain ATCC BAA-258 / DSM 21875 / 2CP-1) TaxID=455488 RepID=B8JCT9_ANAD2|nr:redox-regulated ATPase YchF [Anaeromyxobacter dehalogenans]ACL67809.1 GTP-binding protein YchF [Anaeromyxobacter dehalogenans 2CP-1]